MIGLELNINNDRTTVATQKGVITVNLSHVINEEENTLDLNVRGYNPDKKEHYSWKYLEMKKGDQVIIKVKEIDEISPPDDVKEVISSEDVILEGKLKAFNALKKDLQEAGWL